MPDILFTILSFLVAITILIAVHEFGHFWVAKRLGVKVLRYSIGFGKPIFSRRMGKDNIEFIIASIPLGGYVKMLDEREGEVPADEVHRAFNRQPVAKRFAIVLAGPAFNFLFAIFAYWLMFVVSVTGVKPVIGDVVPESPAQLAGLVKNQEIVAVADKPTPIWSVAIRSLLPALLDQGTITVQAKDPSGRLTKHDLDFRHIDSNVEPEKYLKSIGLIPWQPKGVVKVVQVVAGDPADKAGFKVGDDIVSVNGVAIKAADELVAYISARPEQQLNVVVKREDQKINLNVVPKRVEKEGKVRGLIGLGTADTGEFPEEMKAVYQYPALPAVKEAALNTWNNSVLTLRMLGKMIIGQVSVKNISGPINIARYAGQSASAGFSWFMSFLAIVSLSLGIINLLPIPILDGGHLFYYVIEIFKGSPVSEEFEAIGQRIGIALLILLMTLAFYNDLSRLFGQ